VGIIGTFAGPNFNLSIMEFMFQIIMWQYFLFGKKSVTTNIIYVCLHCNN